MSKKFVCLHGHFYQPPRENPETGEIDRQPSAEPFHDWNERIASECYTPNARAKILASDGEEERLVNNYARMSFNFGPTLLSWLEVQVPETYAAILSADKESARRFGGHGSAMAQAFNHVIMPLANARDKEIQIRWGLDDFLKRFGRSAEGMWLPECAVDIPTLEALARAGVKFTVLSPRQAAGSYDGRRPYKVALPEGRSIAVYFYDGTIAQGIAFDGLLKSGADLAARFKSSFDKSPESAQLVQTATDGESYGHHHEFGEMALAFALETLDADPSVRLTNYAEFLALHPPSETAEIVSPSSWSCAHGVERWRSDCGCSDGSLGDVDQAWRGPLRASLDFLRDRLAAKRGSGFPDSPRYVELERFAQFMYTSCGWFFDDIGRIETVQILRYAARVIGLSKELLGEDWEPEFLAGLKKAKSGDPEAGDGADIYLRAKRRML